MQRAADRQGAGEQHRETQPLDPEGRIIEAFLHDAASHIARNGTILVSICSNSAYEVFDALPLKFKVVAFELGYTGFWRALITARN